jgi:hypothetical protein
MKTGGLNVPRILLRFILFYAACSTGAWGTVSLNADTRQLKGREFGVTMAVDEVYDAFGIACDLVYDPQFLDLVEIASGPPAEHKVTEEGLFNSDGNPTLLRSALEDGVPGILVLGLTRSGNVLGVDALSETDIVTVSFLPKKVGNTTITFQAQALLESNEAAIAVDPWDPVALDITILKGDVDGSFSVDLVDAIRAIKILNGIAAGDVNPDADVDEDGNIGLADVIYILQLEAETREAE